MNELFRAYNSDSDEEEREVKNCDEDLRHSRPPDSKIGTNKSYPLILKTLKTPTEITDVLSIDFERKATAVDKKLKAINLKKKKLTETNLSFRNTPQKVNLEIIETSAGKSPEAEPFLRSEKDIKNFLDNGGDFNQLEKLHSLSGEMASASAARLAQSFKDENESLLLRSVHLESTGTNAGPKLHGEINKSKNQIGTLVQEADNFRLAFEKKRKHSQAAASAATNKYGW